MRALPEIIGDVDIGEERGRDWEERRRQERHNWQERFRADFRDA